jgi:hypothetical protein
MATALLAPNAVMTETKIVAGEQALDGSNPTVLQTGLRAIVSVHLTLQGGAAPGLNTSLLTYTLSGGTVSVFAWKSTSATNPTLVASTGTEVVSYTVVGS